MPWIPVCVSRSLAEKLLGFSAVHLGKKKTPEDEVLPPLSGLTFAYAPRFSALRRLPCPRFDALFHSATA